MRSARARGTGLRAWAAAAGAALVVAPAGCGGDDDAIVESNQATVDGVEYTVTLARLLNPRIEPDSAYYRGTPPGQGRTLAGVFVTACNVSDSPRTTTGDLLLVDNPFETRFEPEQLERDNPFAYRATRLEPDGCVPRPGSAAKQTADATLVVFELPVDALENRPLELVVDEPGGEARLEGAERIPLDL